MIFASVSTHGATGTWLDEILELGVPLVLFIGRVRAGHHHRQQGLHLRGLGLPCAERSLRELLQDAGFA